MYAHMLHPGKKTAHTILAHQWDTTNLKPIDTQKIEKFLHSQKEARLPKSNITIELCKIYVASRTSHSEMSKRKSPNWYN